MFKNVRAASLKPRSLHPHGVYHLFWDDLIYTSNQWSYSCLPRKTCVVVFIHKVCWGLLESVGFRLSLCTSSLLVVSCFVSSCFFYLHFTVFGF